VSPDPNTRDDIKKIIKGELQKIAAQMTSAQIAEAKKHAAVWQPSHSGE
jgi:hypothetical protein